MTTVEIPEQQSFGGALGTSNTTLPLYFQPPGSLSFVSTEDPPVTKKEIEYFIRLLYANLTIHISREADRVSNNILKILETSSIEGEDKQFAEEKIELLARRSNLTYLKYIDLEFEDKNIIMNFVHNHDDKYVATRNFIDLYMKVQRELPQYFLEPLIFHVNDYKENLGIIRIEL